jgi:hypothetical protein
MLEVPLHPAGHQQAAGPIPPGSTTVHLLPAVPIPAGLTGVVRGATAALSPKRPGRHPPPGNPRLPVAMGGVASAAWLAAWRWPQGANLLVPGALCWPPRPAPAAALGPPTRLRPTPQEAAMPTSPSPRRQPPTPNRRPLRGTPARPCGRRPGPGCGARCAPTRVKAHAIDQQVRFFVATPTFIRIA